MSDAPEEFQWLNTCSMVVAMLTPMEIIQAILLLILNRDLFNSIEFTNFVYIILNACHSRLYLLMQDVKENILIVTSFLI